MFESPAVVAAAMAVDEIEKVERSGFIRFEKCLTVL